MTRSQMPRKKRKGKTRKTAPLILPELKAERIGRKLKITASHEGKIIHLDTIDFDLANQRDRFLNGVCKRLERVNRAALEAALLKLPDTLKIEVPASQPDTAPESVTPPVKVTITFLPDLKGKKGTVTAELDGKTVDIDSAFDPLNPKHRARFLKALAQKVSKLDEANADAQLLEIAEQRIQRMAEQNAPPNPAPAGLQAELDISRIVRPEQFITRNVSGLCVPIVISAGDKPMPQWKMYLRWTDGRREIRELVPTIDLADNSRLWVHPIPGEPSLSTAAGWTASARRAWLDGSAAPDPADLFKRICERIAYFIDLPADVAPGATATLTLWSMLTYCFQAWDAVPYLFVGGPMNSGKTRVFEILCRLVYRPLQSSNVTAPALFRTLHDKGGTLLFDEAERLRQNTPEVGEILSMLLAGYKRGGQATRLEADGDTFRTVAFDVYGPKALACIAGLPPTLSSRSISILMFRAAPDSIKPQRRIDADPTSWERLRDDLHALALEHGAKWLELAEKSSVCPQGISGRAYELWQPLLALAFWIESHGAEGLLSLMQKHAFKSLDASREDQIPDADEILLEILTDRVRMGEFPTPGEICTRAKELESTIFDRWTPRTVSKRLKTYGFETRKVDRRREYRHTTLADLAHVQRNYGIDLGIPNSSTETTSHASRIVPEFAANAPESPNSGRNGTKRDAN